MILRKPYAFLIKYFKLINFVISGLAAYIAYQTYEIVTFFNEYISNNYSGNFYKGFYHNYISPFNYLFIVLMLICLLAVFFLFIYKKKPTKVYLTSIIYYVLYIVFLVIITDVMITLETNVITAEMARLYRDISIIVFIPQTILIVIYLIRSLGLNIHKFNFEQDLKEIEIEEKDNEEVEITFKKDSVKLQRNIHRFIREFKYYVKENKFIFSVLCLVLLFIIAFLIYKAMPEIIDSKYNQGDTFIANNLNYTIQDSIITNIDYKGDIITKDKYYLVIRLNIENTMNENIKIDYNNFRLKIKDSYIYPTLNKGKYFIDYAHNEYALEIKRNSKKVYSVVYEIEEKDVKKNYEIKITNGEAILDNKLVGKHNYIKITPIVINKKSVVEIKNINQEVNFSNSNLDNSKLLITNSLITDRYIYDYEYCINDICDKYKDIINNQASNKTLIILDYTFELDSEIPFYNYSKNINTVISTFAKIKYIENEKEVYADIENITPSKMKNQIAIKTTSKIKNSKDVYLSITIRNKEYLIKIK